MLHTLHNKIKRLSNLIAEYEEGERSDKNPNPALHNFVQKVKRILVEKTETTKKDGLECSISDSNRNDNVSDSSPPPQQINAVVSNPNPSVLEALKNHVVLTEIFKCGCYHDLKNFRLINKQWKEIANSAIVKRRIWMISLRNTICSYNNNINNALSALKHCIEGGVGIFPLTAIEFSDIKSYKTLDKSSLDRIYNLIGLNIIHAEFHNFGVLTMDEFQDLLVYKMPNLEHISAGNIFFGDQKGGAPIVLPHLKTIKFISYEMFTFLPYYKVLLQAAINLKEIQDFRVQLTDIVIETGKLHCIKAFMFALELETSTLCDQFSNLEPKLTRLSITPNYFYININETLTVELKHSLETILFSSKDTLKHLGCLPCILPVDFKLPKFPNLEFLTVRDYSNDADYISRVFPPECDVNESFPNVHTVSLFFSGNKTLKEYFPDQAFLSVKTLWFQDNFEIGESLKTIFPKVSHIKFMEFYRTVSQMENVRFPGGFHFEFDPKIESLEFYQCRVADVEQKFLLDSLFTGLSPHICKNLLKIHNNGIGRDENKSVEFVKEFLKLVQRENYMFRNCEGLRRLKVIFNSSMNYHFIIPENSNGDAESWNAVISPISCVYGFSLMPNLEQVIIGYDHYLPSAADIAKVLKPLAEFPFVKIVHEPTV